MVNVVNPRTPTSFPERVGRYELLLPIASGGMATVYLGRVESGFDFEREVAVKLVHGHLRSEGFEQDLVEEAKLAGRIRHPNVVQTLDVGDDPAGVYLVMDYVEGEALSGLMRALRDGPPLRSGVALRALVSSLRGLHAAHELRDAEGRPVSLVHRDFSPQNILVGVDGEAKLADFGIAKAATRLTHTATGVIKGKYGYMAPEQALASSLDRRVDIWAAAVIAWEIALRRRLHPGGNEAATLLRIVNDDAPRLREIDPSAPQELDDVLAAALCRDPKRRTPTAEALADAIERACAGTDWELADTREVREAVQRVTGTKLEERRNAAAEMRRLRKTMGALAASAPLETSVSPFGPIRAIPARAIASEPEREAPTAPDRPLDAELPTAHQHTVDSMPTWKMSPAREPSIGAAPARRNRIVAAAAFAVAAGAVIGVSFGVLRSPVVSHDAQARVGVDPPTPSTTEMAPAVDAAVPTLASPAPPPTSSAPLDAAPAAAAVAEPSASVNPVRRVGPGARTHAPARPPGTVAPPPPPGRPLLGLPSSYGREQ